jgi:hypothetical protein
MSLVLSACAPSTDSQVWTTKGESMLGMAGDAPTLNLGESLPVAPSAENLREPAISLLLDAVESNHALLRANAIEALQGAPEHVEPAVRRGLGDENRGVRFVAAMTVAKLRLESVI